MNGDGYAERTQRACREALKLVPEGRKARVEARAIQVPPLYRAGYLRAAAGKASPRAAMKAFCLECMGWDRGAVAACTALACSHYGYRPWRSG